jgi:hypothetical protein
MKWLDIALKTNRVHQSFNSQRKRCGQKYTKLNPILVRKDEMKKKMTKLNIIIILKKYHYKVVRAYIKDH